MAKTFKITEEQYRMAMNEGVTLDVSQRPGETQSVAAKRTLDDAQKAGMNTQKTGATLKVNPTKTTDVMQTTTTTMESRVVKKDKLDEGRLNELKKNSKVYSIADFMKMVTKND